MPLGYIGAGIAQEFGRSMQQDSLLMRQAALEEIRAARQNEMQRGLLREDRSWREVQAQLDRDHRTGLAEMQRDTSLDVARIGASARGGAERAPAPPGMSADEGRLLEAVLDQYMIEERIPDTMDTRRVIDPERRAEAIEAVRRAMPDQANRLFGPGRGMEEISADTDLMAALVEAGATPEAPARGNGLLSGNGGRSWEDIPPPPDPLGHSADFLRQAEEFGTQDRQDQTARQEESRRQHIDDAVRDAQALMQGDAQNAPVAREEAIRMAVDLARRRGRIVTEADLERALPSQGGR